MSLYESVKADLKLIIRDVPKWKLSILVVLAIMFIKSKRKMSRVISLGLIGFLGYKWIFPHLENLTAKYNPQRGVYNPGVQYPQVGTAYPHGHNNGYLYDNNGYGNGYTNYQSENVWNNR